jgi:hypothetical protein
VAAVSVASSVAVRMPPVRAMASQSFPEFMMLRPASITYAAGLARLIARSHPGSSDRGKKAHLDQIPRLDRRGGPGAHWSAALVVAAGSAADRKGHNSVSWNRSGLGYVVGSSRPRRAGTRVGSWTNVPNTMSHSGITEP